MYFFNSLFSIDFSQKELYIGDYPVPLDYIETLIEKLLHIGLVLILMTISIRIGNSLISKFVKRQIKSKASFTLDEKKANTIGEVLKSVLRYSVYFFGIAAILANIFTGMSLTLASIGGVALGFGAQSLVKDLINGFFILFEDQYAVGDYITLSNYSGIVESIGIRTTVLKDFNGDMHLIPNGVISQVTNHSRGAMRVMVDVAIPYEENIDKVTNIINKVCEKVSDDNENVIDKPKVLGIDSLNNSTIVIKVLGTAKPMSQWELERNLKKEIKLALDKEGIGIPYPKTELINYKNIDE